MIPEDFERLIAALVPVEGKRNEYYCPVCGSENLKATPPKFLINTWECGCPFEKVMSAAFPKAGSKPKAPPARPRKKGRPKIKPTRVSEGDPCKACGNEDTACEYTSRDIRCEVATEATAEADCPPGFIYFGEVDGKQGYIKGEVVEHEQQPKIDPNDPEVWRQRDPQPEPEPKTKTTVEAQKRDQPTIEKAEHDGDDDDGDDSSDRTPSIEIRSGQIVEAAEKVLEHFSVALDPKRRIYSQGNSQGYHLVRILQAVPTTTERFVHQVRGNDALEILSPESLQCEINRAFQIHRVFERDGEEIKQRIDCPAGLAKHILAMGRWPQLPVLHGVVYTPLLTKGGYVVTDPGYHEGSGHLLQFRPEDFEIRQNPTRDDAIEALGILKDLLGEFCFKSEVDRSVGLSLLLTSVSRKLYPLAPLHAVTAHQPGTGKGTLVNIASIFATGSTEVGASSFTDDEAEMSKKVLSHLLSGSSMINIDNVDRRLGGGTLERLITTEFFKERILGVSKNAVCSTQVLITANGNNLAFTTDMARRTVLAELDAGVELPEARKFRRDIEAYALENRGKFVSAAITILMAFLQAGSPVASDQDGNLINPPKLGSFGGWDAVVRRSLLWLGEADPVKSQATIRDADDSRIALSVLLEAWYQELNSDPKIADASYPSRTIVQLALTGGQEFKNAVLDVCVDRQGQLSNKLLGYYLRRNAGVVVNGLRLVRGTKTKSGVTWKVERIENSNRPETSSPSSPPNGETSAGQGFQGGDDGDGIVTAKQEELLEQAASDQKKVTMLNHRHHRHRGETSTGQAFQGGDGDDGDDGDDVSSRFDFVKDQSVYVLLARDFGWESGAKIVRPPFEDEPKFDPVNGGLTDWFVQVEMRDGRLLTLAVSQVREAQAVLETADAYGF